MDQSLKFNLDQIPLYELEKQMNEYIKNRKKDIVNKLEPEEVEWHLNEDANTSERIEFFMKEGLGESNARRLAELNIAYEVDLLIRVEDGKIIGAEGYYFSEKKYKK